jgi:hypothetical protein
MSSINKELHCNGCSERKLGCHATCDHYLSWRAKLDAEISNERKARYLNNIGTTKKAVRRK